MPNKEPPTPPPRRWNLLIVVPTLAKFRLRLVWRRLCDVVLFPSSPRRTRPCGCLCTTPVWFSSRQEDEHHPDPKETVGDNERTFEIYRELLATRASH